MSIRINASLETEAFWTSDTTQSISA